MEAENHPRPPLDTDTAVQQMNRTLDSTPAQKTGILDSKRERFPSWWGLGGATGWVPRCQDHWAPHGRQTGNWGEGAHPVHLAGPTESSRIQLHQGSRVWTWHA